MKMFVSDGSPDFSTVIHDRTVVLGSFASDQYETIEKQIPLTTVCFILRVL